MSEPERSPRRVVDHIVNLADRPLVTAVFVAFGLWILMRMLEKALWVLVVVLLAMILAATISPIVKAMRSVRLPPGGWRIPKPLAVVFIYLLTALGIGLTAYLVGRSVVADLTAFLTALPGVTAHLFRQLQEWAAAAGVQELVPSPVAIAAQVQQLTDRAIEALGFTGVFVGHVVEFFFRLFIVLTLTVFLVTESERILAFWVELFPPDQREKAREVTTRCGEKVGYWALGQLAVAIITGVLAGAWASVLGLPYPALIGVVTALLDLAPVVGPGLMVLPAFFLGLSQSLLIALVAAAGFYALSQFDGNVLSPLITGRAVRISPTFIIIAVPMGLALYGAIGALIAIPVAAVLQVLTLEVFLPWLREKQGVAAPPPLAGDERSEREGMLPSDGAKPTA